MSWIRLDDDFGDHPKLVAAGPLACLLHVRALVYCGRHMTDGRIPRNIIGSLVDWATDGVSEGKTGEPPNNYELAERLVAAGLWERDGTGYVIHDYLEYNPSRAKILEERAKTAERVRRHRNGVTT